MWPVNIYLIQFSFTPTYKLSENGECILLYHKAELLVHDYFVVSLIHDYMYFVRYYKINCARPRATASVVTVVMLITHQFGNKT